MTYSYLNEEQLYASWEERSALLTAAHRFEAVEPSARREAERQTNVASGGAGREGDVERRALIERLKRQVHDEVSRAQRAPSPAPRRPPSMPPPGGSKSSSSARYSRRCTCSMCWRRCTRCALGVAGFWITRRSSRGRRST